MAEVGALFLADILAATLEEYQEDRLAEEAAEAILGELERRGYQITEVAHERRLLDYAHDEHELGMKCAAAFLWGRMPDQTAIVHPSRVLVVSACGHWWRESRPEGLRVDLDQPRVCTLCKPSHRHAVGASDQGLGLFKVVYLDAYDEAAKLWR